MHRFRYNEVILFAGNYIIVISSPGAFQLVSLCRFWESYPDFLLSYILIMHLLCTVSDKNEPLNNQKHKQKINPLFYVTTQQVIQCNTILAISTIGNLKHSDQQAYISSLNYDLSISLSIVRAFCICALVCADGNQCAFIMLQRVCNRPVYHAAMYVSTAACLHQSSFECKRSL